MQKLFQSRVDCSGKDVCESWWLLADLTLPQAPLGDKRQVDQALSILLFWEALKNFSMCGKTYWVRSRYRFTVTLKSPQIRICQLDFRTGTIGVVLNSAALTLEMMPKFSCLSNFISIFDLSAYGTGLGLKSLYWASSLTFRCALKPLIGGKLKCSNKSLNSSRRFSRFEGVRGATWGLSTWYVACCIVRKLNSAIYSRPIIDAVSGLSMKTTRSRLSCSLSRTSTYAIR